MANNSKKLKIALFYNLDFGGAKRAAFEHVKGLKKLGHTVDVYTTDQQKDIFNFENIADHYYSYKYVEHDGKIPLLSRGINDFKTFYFLKKLHKQISKEIDNNKYDFVVVHPDKITQSPFLLRFLKTNNLYYCQEPLRIAYEYVLMADRKKLGNFKYLYEIWTRNIRKNIDIKNVRSAHHTVASCYHVRERMIESYGVWADVSYLGIDEKLFKPLGIKKKNQVLFLGNKEVYNDGFDLAQKAVSLIPKKVRPTIQIVPWRKENNERLTDGELVKYYNESKITLSLSRFETFGLTPLESLSCGTPVIATNVSGHRETITSDCGGSLVEFNPEQISVLIKDYLANNKRSLKGRDYILKNWTWEKRIKEFEVLILKYAN